MEAGYDEPMFLISVVAKILDIHPQTLRQYEKEGLIEPSRTNGKTRLYSQRDVDKIRSILKLTRDLGVNLAGVDIILRLKERMDELDRINNDLRNNLHKQKDENTNNNNNSDLVAIKSSYDLVLHSKD